MYVGELLATFGYPVQRNVLTDATSARAIEVRRQSTCGYNRKFKNARSKRVQCLADNPADMHEVLEGRRSAEILRVDPSRMRRRGRIKRRPDAKAIATLFGMATASPDYRRHEILRSILTAASVASVNFSLDWWRSLPHPWPLERYWVPEPREQSQSKCSTWRKLSPQSATRRDERSRQAGREAVSSSPRLASSNPASATTQQHPMLLKARTWKRMKLCSGCVRENEELAKWDVSSLRRSGRHLRHGDI